MGSESGDKPLFAFRKAVPNKDVQAQKMRKITNILEKSRHLLEEYALCDHCLGRQFALLGHGLTNEERGKAIKQLLVLESCKKILDGKEEEKSTLRLIARNGFSKVAAETLKDIGIEIEKEEKKCYICQGIFDDLDDLATKIAEKLSKFEFETFLIGVKAREAVENREDELRAKFNIRWGESIRCELSREIGKRVSKIMNKRVNYEKPDIIVLTDPFANTAKLQVNPLFIAGRYRKLVRGIPQTKWINKKYSESVEELISKPVLEVTGGIGAKFHGAGREDVDARVLGSGRPFVIEVKAPKKRKVDLREIERKVNRYARGRVEVSGLRFSSKSFVRKIKSEGQAEKLYKIIVEFGRRLSDDELMKLEKELAGRVIQQRTPLRVLRHRSDKLREKHIYEAKVKRKGRNKVEILIRCQGGLYVKELVTGDQGRTTPNISQIVGAQAKCVELDVMEVYI